VLHIVIISGIQLRPMLLLCPWWVPCLSTYRLTD